jgi:hypothetical protein
MKVLKAWPNTYFERRRPSTDWLLSEKRRLVLKTGGSFSFRFISGMQTRIRPKIAWPADSRLERSRRDKKI